jgi:hypothetical protein
VLLVHKVHKDFKEHKVFKVQLVYREQLVHKDFKEQHLLAHKV